jgi:ubiquinone biosynthesis protein UbiJ
MHQTTTSHQHKEKTVENSAKVVTMRNKNDDVEIALIKQELTVIKDNHLKHLKDDVEKIDKKVDRLDQRIWWILGILVAGTVGPMLAKLFT